MTKEVGNGNLIPFDQLSEERQREIRSMGGKASAAKKRKRKSMRDALDYILANPATDKRIRNQAADMLGIEPEEVDNQALILASMLKESLKGSVQAASFVRDTIGEMPVKEIQVEEIIATPLAPIDESDM
jgi:hypothetical protein